MRTVLLLGWLLLTGQNVVAYESKPYGQVLMAFVNQDGLVNYKGLKQNSAQLETYLASLNKLTMTIYQDWSEPAQLAMWLNAYNASVLKTIMDHYPIKKRFPSSLAYPNGIQQIANVWKEKRYNIMGEKLSLDDIEHKKIRKLFKEPRIHMALVCAAKSCPNLRNEPYDGKKLDEQLADQSKNFLNRADRYKVDYEKRTIHVSKIFDWFGDDFGSPKKEAIVQFIELYAPISSNESEQGASLKNFKVDYLPYDWNLNEQK